MYIYEFVTYFIAWPSTARLFWLYMCMRSYVILGEVDEILQVDVIPVGPDIVVDEELELILDPVFKDERQDSRRQLQEKYDSKKHRKLQKDSRISSLDNGCRMRFQWVRNVLHFPDGLNQTNVHPFSTKNSQSRQHPSWHSQKWRGSLTPPLKTGCHIVKQGWSLIAHVGFIASTTFRCDHNEYLNSDISVQLVPPDVFRGLCNPTEEKGLLWFSYRSPGAASLPRKE